MARPFEEYRERVVFRLTPIHKKLIKDNGGVKFVRDLLDCYIEVEGEKNYDK